MQKILSFITVLFLTFSQIAFSASARNATAYVKNDLGFEITNVTLKHTFVGNQDKQTWDSIPAGGQSTGLGVNYMTGFGASSDYDYWHIVFKKKGTSEWYSVKDNFYCYLTSDDAGKLVQVRLYRSGSSMKMDVIPADSSKATVSVDKYIPPRLKASVYLKNELPFALVDVTLRHTFADAPPEKIIWNRIGTDSTELGPLTVNYDTGFGNLTNYDYWYVSFRKEGGTEWYTVKDNFYCYLTKDDADKKVTVRLFTDGNTRKMQVIPARSSKATVALDYHEPPKLKATVFVKNEMDYDIASVTIRHTFAENPPETKTWATIAAGQTVGSLTVNFDTGFGDWTNYDYWWVEYYDNLGRYHTCKPNFYCYLKKEDADQNVTIRLKRGKPTVGIKDWPMMEIDCPKSSDDFVHLSVNGLTMLEAGTGSREHKGTVKVENKSGRKIKRIAVIHKISGSVNPPDLLTSENLNNNASRAFVQKINFKTGGICSLDPDWWQIFVEFEESGTSPTHCFTFPQNMAFLKDIASGKAGRLALDVALGFLIPASPEATSLISDLKATAKESFFSFSFQPCKALWKSMVTAGKFGEAGAVAIEKVVGSLRSKAAQELIFNEHFLGSATSVNGYKMFSITAKDVRPSEVLILKVQPNSVHFKSASSEDETQLHNWSTFPDGIAPVMRGAEVVIETDVKDNIDAVIVAHKYSDLYRQYLANTEWEASGSTLISKDPFFVTYNTGPMTTGMNWWIVLAITKDGKFMISNPQNLGKINLGKIIDNITKVTDTVLGFVLPVVATSAVADPLSCAAWIGVSVVYCFINGESIEGFKGHTLSFEDHLKTTRIIIGKSAVTFKSPSGSSATTMRTMNHESELVPFLRKFKLEDSYKSLMKSQKSKL